MPFHEHSVEVLLLQKHLKQIAQKYSQRLFLECG